MRVVQTVSHYDGRVRKRDKWTWAVRLDGTAQELKTVQYVVYELHESYRDPIQIVDDPRNNFRLFGASYGSFTIGVEIYFKHGTPGMSGKKLKAKIKLRLFYPTGLYHRIED